MRQVMPAVAVDAIEQFVAPFDVSLLSDDLYDMQRQIASNVNVPFVIAGSAVGGTTMLTVGYVMWALRSGWLATSVLAQMPAWRLVDPLVVLNYLDEESEESLQGGRDDDSLESLLEREERRHEQAEHEAQGEFDSHRAGVWEKNQGSTHRP